MDYVKIGDVRVSRFILGSNPFSGFSHQGPATDSDMKHYFTTARIKDTIRAAEGLGVNAVLARADHHMMRVLLEHWDEGSGVQWFAQTCPELGSPEVSINRAGECGARACHIHGGVMDFLLAQNQLADVPRWVDMIHEKGMRAGIAGHNPQVFEWAESAGLGVDYYMCSYYNSAHRDERAEHVSGMKEWFLDEDRKIMTALIPKLSKPVIHYKVMAAGRNDPAEAFATVARTMRPGDAVCVGIYDPQGMALLREDVALLERYLAVEVEGIR